ncbi:ribosomal protein S10 domain-containing protein [Sordaria brevicollis]|uniref:Small ribosomal subunit protein uS10m n=1 Tax=Sordaria brevicollis TaxID=83679 RepID=A0AAE0P1P7_SORBR|nr:ribosomal protein S10 domain-containing protein [Sordaria brevicollis]
MILRPAVRSLRGRAPLATFRSAQSVFQPLSQLRGMASVITGPDAASPEARLSPIAKITTTTEPPKAKNKAKAAPTAESEDKAFAMSRMPRSLEALYLQPLRREAEYGVPTCDLQLRSYSVRNLEFFCDFALRAAYYLGLPAFGPVPLPRMIERWTVPKSHFIFKKSQENFERITLRRLIQIKDGHPETVQLWLAFLQKHAYYGIGMKANVWEFSKLGVSKAMDESKADVEKLLETRWEHLSHVSDMKGVGSFEDYLAKERRRISGGR